MIADRARPREAILGLAVCLVMVASCGDGGRPADPSAASPRGLHATFDRAADASEGVSRGFRQRPEGDKVIDSLYGASQALVIGISAYQRDWQALPGVTADVERISNALRDQGFTVTNVNNPKGQELRDALQKAMAVTVKPPSRLVVFYAGHGYTLTNGSRQVGYMVPTDAPNPHLDATGFRQVAVPLTAVEAEAKASSIHHILFVFDCCFAGTFFDHLPRSANAGLSTKDALAKPMRLVLTAGSANQEVPDISVFTPAVVAGLGGEADDNGDGVTTGMELCGYVSRRVAALNGRRQTCQYGAIRDPDLSNGDLLFSGKVAATTGDGSPQKPPASTAFRPVDTGPIAKPAWASAFGQDQQGVWADFKVEGVTQRFRFCPPGRLSIGTRDLSHATGFWMADTECTQAMWSALLGERPSQFRGNDLPVESISFLDVTRCITHLRNQPAMPPIRIPTVEEWQYTATAGAGDRPGPGWHRRTSALKTQPVKKSVPNAWGIHDLTGNVAEWAKGQGPEMPRCGGSWNSPPEECTANSINSALPEVKVSTTGVRFVIDYQAPP